MPDVFDDAAEYADVVKKDHWQMQPRRVEVWCEKDSVIGSIEDLTDKLGVTVRVARGFLSTTKAFALAQTIGASKKPMTVFYLGDHDPSGRQIESDLAEHQERLSFFQDLIQSGDLPGPLLDAERRGEFKKECLAIGMHWQDVDAPRQEVMRPFQKKE